MSLTKADLVAIEKLLGKQRKDINGDLVDFISDAILPQIDSLHTKVDRIEKKLDKHDRRIENLEDIHPKGKHSLVLT